VRVGLRDPDSAKYVGESSQWDAAERACKDAAKTLGVPFTEEPGEAAFYGPKIDFVIKDVIGREWQLGTVQVDYVLPVRFDLSYIGADNQAHRPVMIHRAPFGSMERFCGVLIEHFGGDFPVWLAPEQVRLVPISDKVNEYGAGLLAQLKAAGVRATIDEHSDKLGAKIRRAELDKVLHGSYKVVESLFCNVRPGKEKGHEHFGFLDGISQPGVAGFTKLHKGQDAVSPGIFLLGNDTETHTSTLAKDGSFLSFRKLNQRVPEFNAFLLKNGTGLDGLTPKEGADFLGARLIGRWKSGAPIDIAPLKDDPALGADPERNNDFKFSFTNPDDQTDQTRCPFAAHVRKTYPRDDLEKNGGNIDNRRILRQGCPFGPELTDEEQNESKTLNERGLAFACYQSSLTNGFTFIQKSWANNPNFIFGKGVNPGFDAIIGQAGSATRSMLGFDPKAQTNSLSLPDEFVVSRGGEYFFVPSIKALKQVIAC